MSPLSAPPSEDRLTRLTGTVAFQAGTSARVALGPVQVTVVPSIEDGQVRDHLVTVFAGFPPPSWVRDLSWQLERDGKTIECRTDARGQFSLGPLTPGEYVLRLRSVEQDRAERIEDYIRDRDHEGTAALLREVLDERGTTLDDKPAGGVVESILAQPPVSTRKKNAEELVFLKTCASLVVLDWLADAARSVGGDSASADPLAEPVSCTRGEARRVPGPVLAWAEAWESERSRDEPAALDRLRRELADSSPARVVLKWSPRRRWKPVRAFAAAAVLLLGIGLFLALSGPTPQMIEAPIDVFSQRRPGEAWIRSSPNQSDLFPVSGTVNVAIRSPKAGFATIVWIEGEEVRVYPGDDEKTPKVEADESKRLEIPLQLIGNEGRVLVVISPKPAAELLRKSLPRDRKFLADEEQVKKKLFEELTKAGLKPVVFGSAALERAPGQ